MKALLSVCALSLALTACTSAEVDEPEPGANGEVAIDTTLGEITETGFAVADRTGLAVTLVKSNADIGGQIISVTTDFLDADGEVIATATGLSGFTAPGQTIAVIGDTPIRGKGTEVADIESTVSIDSTSELAITDVDLGTAEGSKIRKDGPYFTAEFTFTNKADIPLTFPDVAAVCRNADGEIVGGGLDFAGKIKPKKEATVTPFLVVSEKPEECTAYIAAPIPE